MIVKNFNNVEIKERIKSIICYNEEMAIIRILNEGTPEAAAVIFKGYNDFKEIMTEEEKEQIDKVNTSANKSNSSKTKRR
jgi:hypothetical protein